MKDRWIKKYKQIQPFRRFVLFFSRNIKIAANKFTTFLRLKPHTTQRQNSARRYSKVKKTVKKVHYHVAKKPHEKLLSNSRRYYWWHTWEYKRLHHGHVHFAILLVWVVAASLVTYRTFASPNDTNVWTFNNPADYTFANDKIEPSSNNLRLSLRDKIENFTLAGGKLQSNNVLEVAADDTYYYVSNDLGIDVIRQDTWQRTAFITSGGGFPAVAVENGYLYAGKNGGIYRWQVSSLTNNTPLGSYRYTTTTTPALSDNEIVRLNTKTIANKVYVVAVTSQKVHIIKDEQGTVSIVGPNALTGSDYIINAKLTSSGDLYYLYRSNDGMTTSGNGALFVTYGAINKTSNWAYNSTNVSVDYGQNNIAAQHGPLTTFWRSFTNLDITEGTSTANNGDNTMYLSTEQGLVIIQENRTTPANSTITSFTESALGSNAATGSTVQSRIDTPQGTAPSVVDNNYASYYLANGFTNNVALDWLELDLGASKTFNHLRQSFWVGNQYMPTGYVLETSTQGTSPNIAGNATALSMHGYNDITQGASKALDSQVGTGYISNTNISGATTGTYWFEQIFPSPTQLSAIDLHFWETSRSAKDYVIESSSQESVIINPVSATASSVYQNNATYGADKAIDDNNSGSRWISQVSGTSPQWLSVNLGSAQTVRGVEWLGGSDTGRLPKNYSIQYSTDNINWTTAKTITNNQAINGRVVFDSAVTASYVRIYITEAYGGYEPNIVDFRVYSNMFENGTVTQLANVVNNSQIARLHTFASTTAKVFRLRASQTVGNTLGIREFKSYQSHFENGTVNQVSSVSNLTLSDIGYKSTLFNSHTKAKHFISFPSTSARHVRVRYTGVPLTYQVPLISELQLYNTSTPEWFPGLSWRSAINPNTNQFYAVLNTGASEDGRIVRVDGVQANAPNIAEVITRTSKPELSSNEFTSIRIADSNKMVVGTSNAGASFIGKRYATDLPTVTPNNAYSPPAVASWKTFEESATKNGGEVYYQISNDDGVSWYFWNGTSWAIAGPNDRNTAAEINTNISDFSVGTRDFKWKAFLSSDGSQEVTLQSVTVTINPDVTPPAVNADNIQMYTSNGGTGIAEEAWAKTGTPYFSWDEAEDDTNPGATGIKGYCLYLGQDETVDLSTTKGLFGVSPVNTDGACAYAVPANSIDLSQPGKLASQLVSSDSFYYLHIKAIDYSDNIFPGAATSFRFKFDNTPPASPGYITGPSQFLATRDVTLSWPITGNGAISDAHSGVVGLQYRIGDGTWYGSNHNGAQDASDLLENNGSYRMNETYDYPLLIEGNNIVYFRTLDAAGNYSVVYATAVVKINTASPSSPQSVVVTPPTNTTNAFGFSWSAPATFVGSSAGLKYCYTVNTLPTVNTCTFTAAGVTSLPSGPFATQPGENNFYVVAQDEAGNINYATYASATFSANTSAPGMPLNMEVADISTKSTSKWKVAVSWSNPEDVGAGIANYRVFRSINNQNFTQISSSSGVSYVDANLAQQTYYYRVQACDSANNCGAFGSTVSMYPTGKFTEPPELVSPPVVSNITTKRARVTWATNRESDSRILIGKERGKYSSSEISNSAQVTAHTVDLDNLDAGTTYYILAQWTDEDGNTGRSNELSFKTEPAPYTEEVLVQRVGLSTAQIRFTSISAAKVVIQYGTSDSFGGVREISTSLSKSTYDVELSGLNDGTKYSYRLNTFDSEGNEYRGGTVLSFTTPARPRISNLRFQPLEGEPTSTQQISWKTNVPTTSLIRYTQKGGAKQELSDSKLTTEHELVIKDLVDDSEYSLVAESRDADGNLAVSDAQILKTALDTRPPKISKLKVETSIRGSGSEARGQIVVSWQTDEPATSQVAYDQGSGLSKLNKRTSEDAALSTEHIVIIADLATSRVYSVSPISKDKATNEVSGSTKSAIIEKPSDNVMTIVLNALKGVFGF